MAVCKLVIAVVRMGAARLLRMGVDVDRDQVVQIHEMLPFCFKSLSVLPPALEHIEVSPHNGMPPTIHVRPFGRSLRQVADIPAEC